MERIDELLRAGHGVLPRRDHRPITRILDRCLELGTLQATLPGVYTAPEPDWDVLIRAAAAFKPGCVITGAAAARVLWWPQCPISAVSAASPRQVKGRYPKFQWQQRLVPPDLVVDRDELRLASPALSILDLLPHLGGAVIDEGLRRKAVCTQDLEAALALLGGRRGNTQRAALLHDSRDEPWSEAERGAHRLLREAGITGWRTNRRVDAGRAKYVVDIVFLGRRVIIEVDGWTYHGDRKSFTGDRWRYARLAAAAWIVLPFAAEAIEDEPEEFISVVRAALALVR